MKGKGLAAMSLVLLLCLSACQRVETPSSPAMGTRQPFPSPNRAPISTPTPTPNPEPDPTPSPEPTPFPEYSFVNNRTQERFTTDGRTNWGVRSFVATYKDELGPYFSIHVDLPWAVAEGEGYAAIDKRFEELMEEYKAEIWEPYSPEDRAFLFSEPSLSVGFSTVELGRLITFRFVDYSYWGGAHGMGSTWVETYDTVTGKELGLADFFTDPAEAAARIKAEIRRQVEADPETYDWLFDARGQIISPLNEDFNPEQCYPVEGGFEVFYQWYTLAGHWAGAPTFFIDGELLADLTRPLGADQVMDLEPWGQRQVILNEHRDGLDILEYSASVPVARRAGPGYDAINDFYPDIDAFLEEAEEILGRIDDIYDQLAFYYYVKYGMGPSFETGGIVQIVGIDDSYLGWLHPISYLNSDQFDLSTGERLTLADLFTDWDAAREIIWDAIEPQAREQLAARDYPAEQIEGPLNYAKDALEEGDPVFLLDQDGLTICYNTYTITSYVFGAFDFSVPKALLQSLTAYPIWG